MEVVILNLGDANRESELEILDLLNVLFSASTSPEEKKKRLSGDFNIAMTTEFESEVRDMCNLSSSLVDHAIQQGIEQGIEQEIEQGIEQGEMKGKKETALNLHNMGMNEDFIAKAVNVSVDLIKQWLGLISA